MTKEFERKKLEKDEKKKLEKDERKCGKRKFFSFLFYVF